MPGHVPPGIPDTGPPRYCHIFHELQKLLMLGQGAVVYCACHSGLLAKSPVFTYGQ
jgi:hypothetical protein